MRNRKVRLAFLGVIFALPWLISAMGRPGSWAPAPASVTAAPLPVPVPATAVLVCQIEAILVAGLLYASLERRRLLARGLGASDGAV